MRKMCLLAVTALLVVPAVASADWIEDFSGTTSSTLGSGLGASYIAGANWSVQTGAASVAGGWVRADYFDPSYGVGSGPGGVYQGNPTRILHNSIDGAGTYYAKLNTQNNAYRTRLVFGYQDASNYYFVEMAHNTDWMWDSAGDGFPGSDIGQPAIGIGAVVNGTKHYFVGRTDLGTDFNVEFTVDWNPTAGTINVDILRGTNSGTLSVADDKNLFNSGNAGAETLQYNQSAFVDGLSFTAVPEPATLAILTLGGVGALLRRRKN